MIYIFVALLFLIFIQRRTNVLLAEFKEHFEKSFEWEEQVQSMNDDIEHMPFDDVEEIVESEECI